MTRATSGTACATFSPSCLQHSFTLREPTPIPQQFNRRPSLPCIPTSPALLSPKSQIAASKRAASWTPNITAADHHILPPASILSRQPAQPLPWLWQCHLCHRSYSLGVTRKCLEDGHIFCAGEPVQRSLSRRRRSSGAVRCGKRGKACASEFDYRGWSEMGKWRRDVGAERSERTKLGRLADRRDSGVSMKTTAVSKDCFNNCDYPSECRWGREEQLQRLEKEVLERETAVAARLDQHRRLSPPTSFEEMLGLSMPNIDREWSFATSKARNQPVSVREDPLIEDDGRYNGGALAFVPYGVKGQMKACGYFEEEDDDGDCYMSDDGDLDDDIELSPRSLLEGRGDMFQMSTKSVEDEDLDDQMEMPAGAGLGIHLM